MFQFCVWRPVLAAAVLLTAASSVSAAENDAWSVSKSSGEVWISTTGVEQASLKAQEILKAGDTVRTGRNGRVLLTRGEETILIAPNSVVGIPTEKKEGLSTTILQQAGSILLEVEKRNTKHFEVETPYLAAIVKGTQFSVSVDASGTRVEVKNGQVEVSDFKSGQTALVMPGQAAIARANGQGGLSLSGAGSLNPIEQGKPRASSIDRVPVPKSGLSAPRNAANGMTIHALAATGGNKATNSARAAAGENKGLRISSALGEVRLNFQRVTNGLAHGAAAPGSKNSIVWNDAKAGVSGTNGNSSSGGAATTTGNGATASPSASAAIASVTDPANNGNGLAVGRGGINPGHALGHGHGHH